MPYNGSGSAAAPAGGNYPAVASTLIESAKYNVLIADILTMLSTALLKDGQQVATQRIPFASGISTDTINEKTSGAGISLGHVLNTVQGTDIASAATLNLETATGNIIDVTGTVTVTAVTLSQGHWRLARFTGALVLTNGASLVLPGATNFTTAAGDYVLFIGYAASVVRAYILPTSGPLPFVDTSPVVIGSADKTKKVRLEVDGLTTATTRVLTVQDSDDTLVGRATTDTLTNKTLTTPTITNPSIDTITGAVVATQANQETASATNLIVSPGRQQFHPSAAKAWIKCDFAGATQASYNITSISDDGTGLVTVTINVDFSSVDYAIIGLPKDAGSTAVSIIINAQAAGTFGVSLRTSANALADVSNVMFCCFGDQP